MTEQINTDPKTPGAAFVFFLIAGGFCLGFFVKSLSEQIDCRNQVATALRAAEHEINTLKKRTPCP